MPRAVEVPWMDRGTAVVSGMDGLPRRIPGRSLELLCGGPAGSFDEAMTVYRGVARVARVFDPLEAGTVLEITELPVEYDALLRHLSCVRDRLRAWQVADDAA